MTKTTKRPEAEARAVAKLVGLDASPSPLTKAVEREAAAQRKRADKREKLIIRKAVAVMHALERVATWKGTGGTNQAKAYDARDKAVDEWNALLLDLGRPETDHGA